ncbi:MAG: hypothetical protein ACJAT4_002232 [Granulosicoccus sp.]|jgi:hypothetical protein
MSRALGMVGYEAFREEQKNQMVDKLLGIGFSTYVEVCGIVPSAVVGALMKKKSPLTAHSRQLVIKIFSTFLASEQKNYWK